MNQEQTSPNPQSPPPRVIPRGLALSTGTHGSLQSHPKVYRSGIGWKFSGSAFSLPPCAFFPMHKDLKPFLGTVGSVAMALPWRERTLPTHVWNKRRIFADRENHMSLFFGSSLQKCSLLRH